MNFFLRFNKLLKSYPTKNVFAVFDFVTQVYDFSEHVPVLMKQIYMKKN